MCSAVREVARTLPPLRRRAGHQRVSRQRRPLTTAITPSCRRDSGAGQCWRRLVRWWCPAHPCTAHAAPAAAWRSGSSSSAQGDLFDAMQGQSEQRRRGGGGGGGAVVAAAPVHMQQHSPVRLASHHACGLPAGTGSRPARSP